MSASHDEIEVGVRELRDRLSECLAKVERGGTIVVTRRGKPIARLSPAERPQPFEKLEQRGLVRLPKKPREVRNALAGSKGSVSGLVKDQRR